MVGVYITEFYITKVVRHPTTRRGEDGSELKWISRSTSRPAPLGSTRVNVQTVSHNLRRIQPKESTSKVLSLSPSQSRRTPGPNFWVRDREDGVRWPVYSVLRSVLTFPISVYRTETYFPLRFPVRITLPTLNTDSLVFKWCEVKDRCLISKNVYLSCEWG